MRQVKRVFVVALLLVSMATAYAEGPARAFSGPCISAVGARPYSTHGCGRHSFHCCCAYYTANTSFYPL